MLLLIQAEFGKSRRTLALLLTLLCPLCVVLLQAFSAGHHDAALIRERGWEFYWQTIVALWCSFMLPLYLGLLTALVNAVEHQHQGWRLMASLPYSRWQLFLAKAAVCVSFAVISSAVLLICSVASVLILMQPDLPATDVWQGLPWQPLALALCCSGPVILLGLLISWAHPSLALPLGVSVVMTMSAMTVVRSAEYWPWHPWTYMMTSALVSAPAARELALQLSGVLTLLLLIAALGYCRRSVLQS